MATQNVHRPESSKDLPPPEARFLLLLISILLLFLVRPFLAGIKGIDLIINGMFTAILITGVYSIAQRKTMLAEALLIAVPWIALRWFLYFEPHPAFMYIEMGLLAVFFAYTSTVILGFLLKAEKVNTDIILGSVCAYFLIGLMWGTVFALIEAIEPGTFQIAASTDSTRFDLIYYSFVALTTLGFGDIQPVSTAARSLTVVEAVMGQIYLAVLVARLVGLHIGGSLNTPGKGS